MSKNPREILDAAARTRVPDDVNLYPRIAAQLERKTFMKTLLAKPALLILSIIFTLALLSGVVYAVGRSLGYIPGVGIVENYQTVRILPKTIAASQDGIIFQVRSLTADSNQTILTYSIYGIPLQIGAATQKCTEAPALQLPNGTRLDASSQPIGGMGGENGLLSFNARIVFPPLAVDVNEVTLLTPCQIPPITLQLIPAPQGMVFPVTEIPATYESSHPLLPTLTPGTPTTTLGEYSTNFPPTLTPVHNGSGLYLEEVIETESAYFLIGNFTDAGDLPGATTSLDEIPYGLSVSDRNGKHVPLWVRPELLQNSSWGNVAYWAIEIPKTFDAPLTISLPQITITDYKTFTFPLDVVANPTIGQTWVINQIIQSGSYSFLVENIRRDERGYTLNFHSLKPIMREDFNCAFQIQEKPDSTLNEQFHESNGMSEWAESLVFDDQVPNGELTFTLDISTGFQAGPWTLTWSPPAK